MSLQESKRFPKSYGDFALQSSDGVICYFPKHVLTYMSPAFHEILNISVDSKDMVQVPPDGSPLEVTETSVVLENLLAHIDPKTLDPCAPMDVATIAETLAAAHKYQVDIILQRFEKEILSLRTEVVRKGTQSTPVQKYSRLLYSNPLLILYLGDIYGLPKVAQQACKMLAGCPSSLIKLDTVSCNLSAHSYHYVNQLREERIRRYRGYIEHLAGHKTETVSEGAIVPVVPSTQAILEAVDMAIAAAIRTDIAVEAVVRRQGPVARPHNAFRTMRPVLGQNRKGCIECPSSRAQWVLALREAVGDTPRWDSFWGAYMKGGRCNKCGMVWPDKFKDDVAKWKQESLDLEAQLPKWPNIPASD
ncbi:hypothetical protein CPB86DRAFT_225605 [Serendipita vermifera]|nr:hypothetical protein CPB86DRAFT_225605 [Serendipita vermifera]